MASWRPLPPLFLAGWRCAVTLGLRYLNRDSLANSPFLLARGLRLVSINFLSLLVGIRAIAPLQSIEITRWPLGLAICLSFIRSETNLLPELRLGVRVWLSDCSTLKQHVALVAPSLIFTSLRHKN